MPGPSRRLARVGGGRGGGGERGKRLACILPAAEDSGACVIGRARCQPPDQVMDVLELVCKKESLVLPKQVAAKIAANAKGNLRRAILMLETSKVQRYGGGMMGGPRVFIP